MTTLELNTIFIEYNNTFDNVWILCIGFINFMLNDKSFLDYTNLFSANDYEENDEVILKYF